MEPRTRTLKTQTIKDPPNKYLVKSKKKAEELQKDLQQ